MIIAGVSLQRWTLLAVLALITAPAAAQEESFNFEVTPFAAYRVGGSFNEKDGTGRIEMNEGSARV